MTRTGQRIIIFGGTFDPVHDGHVAIVRIALKYFKPSKLVVVPAFQNPLKEKEPGASALQRVQMCKKVFSPILKVSVCEFEVRKKRPVYTIETVHYLRKRFGLNKKYIFVCGADTLKNLSQWRDIDTLCKICSFAAADRSGALWNSSDRIEYRIPMRKINIEATELRKQIRRGDFKNSKIPSQITQFIKENKLYGYQTVKLSA